MSKKRDKRSWIERLLGGSPKNLDVYDDKEYEELNDNFEEDEDLDNEEEEFDEEFNDDPENNVDKNIPTSSDKEDLDINLVDNGKELVLKASIPGLEPENIDIYLTRDMLSIETNSNEECFETKGDYLYDEFFYGSFFRSILLTSEVELNLSYAEIKNGILTVVMPKADKDTKIKLSIKKK